MREYIQIIVFQITSTRSYIVITISEKRGRTPRVVEYVFVLAVLYIIAIYLLHKVYRFFVGSVLKQKSKFFLACDAVLYEYQNQNIKSNQDLSWIETILKEGSYEKSYNLFLEKSDLFGSDELTKKLKNTHAAYINSSRRKMLCGAFLLIVTFGIYKLFLVT